MTYTVVLCASKYDKHPLGLEHIRNEFGVVIDSSNGWANAANQLLDVAVNSIPKADNALFIDDDVTLSPYTFDLLERYYDAADVFGFTLVLPNNPHGVQSAGYVFSHEGFVPQNLRGVLTPSYVPHVTASCMLIKRHVLEAGIRFPIWPGVHREDVAFCLDCWLHGFKVAYLPGIVEHDLQGDGVGATKQYDPELERKLIINRECLREWMSEHKIAQALAERRIPLEAIPIVLDQRA